MEDDTVSMSSFSIRQQTCSSPRLQPLGSSPKKRKFCLDDIADESHKENKVISTSCGHRNFLRIPHSNATYHTEEWKCKQTTLYSPLKEDIMVNVARMEQISFGAGSYFIADDAGQYCGNKEGNVIHLWRYSENLSKLYISRSFLFLDAQSYIFLRRQLEDV